MIKNDEKTIIKAISLCFKPFLKTEEAMIYCNLGRTQFAKKCHENNLYKNTNGYYKKVDLDKMMEGKKSHEIHIKSAY